MAPAPGFICLFAFDLIVGLPLLALHEQTLIKKLPVPTKTKGYFHFDVKANKEEKKPNQPITAFRLEPTRCLRAMVRNVGCLPGNL